MDYIKILKTSRPLFWFTHFTLLICGAIYARTFNIFTLQFLLALLIFSLPFSIFIYAINDFYDVKTDLNNPRKAGIFGEKHSQEEVSKLKFWGFCGLLISLVGAYFLGIFELITITILALVLYFYSSFPLRFKSIPIIDAITGGGLYFYLTMAFGYFTQANSNLSIFLKSPFIVIAFLGLIGHLMGAILDEETDKKEGIKTSVVVFGANKVVTFCLLLILACIYLTRSNLIYVFLLCIFYFICSLSISKKLRTSYLVQRIGGVYFPLIFFGIVLILYLINPLLLLIEY